MDYLVVDGMNFAYRANSVFFENKTSNGIPSGLFYGFLTMLQSLKKKHRNYKIVVAWDNKAKWKYDINPMYKSNRTSLGSGVKSQVEDVKEYLKNIEIDQYEMPGEEADDVIATIVEKFKNKEDTKSVLILTNDKDMLQLVDGVKVIVLRPKVGNTPEKYFDIDAIKDKFGVSPDKLAEFRAIAGDGSDTIPGVYKVRRNKIATCIEQASNLDVAFDIFKDSSMSEKERAKLTDFKDQAFLNYKIMKLNRNLDNIQETEGSYDIDILNSLLSKYEIKSIKAELMADLFRSSLNIRYTDSRPAYQLESFSLFD